MSEKISSSLKKLVAENAKFCCEYCLMPERISFYNFHIDHIISLKHGGLSVLENLAYSCPDCNFFKGSDVGTYSGFGDKLVRFFNPRKDKWYNHFSLEQGIIIGKTDIGISTIKIFKLNEMDRLIFRNQLIELGLYPSIKL